MIDFIGPALVNSRSFEQQLLDAYLTAQDELNKVLDQVRFVQQQFEIAQKNLQEAEATLRDSIEGPYTYIGDTCVVRSEYSLLVYPRKGAE